MIDLDSLDGVLIFYKNLGEFKLNIIKTHNWIKDGKRPRYCAWCNIRLIDLLHSNINLNSVIINELTCNEIIIKRLLE